MTLDMILIAFPIIGTPLVAWLAIDTYRLRRDLDDAYLLVDDHDLRISELDGQVETIAERVFSPADEGEGLPVPDVDEHLDVPDYDAVTTPTYRPVLDDFNRNR